MVAYSDLTFLVANATDSNTELIYLVPTHLLNTKFPGHVVNSSNKTVKNTIKQSESKLEWTNIYEGQVSTSTGHITPDTVISMVLDPADVVLKMTSNTEDWILMNQK